MIILAVDSSATAASAAVCDGYTVLAAKTLCNGLTHSETLLPLVCSVMEDAKVSFDDIELYCVSTGPGSFTGIRIGTAMIKGLAFGNRKCVGVSTLEALAYNLRSYDGIICPVMDARRSQLYNAIFECRGGVLTRLSADRLIPAEELESELVSIYKGKDVYFCGDGYEVAKASVHSPNIRITDDKLIIQNAASVAAIGYKDYLDGKAVSDGELRPVYLRDAQAERERKERLLKNGKQ